MKIVFNFNSVRPAGRQGRPFRGWLAALAVLGALLAGGPAQAEGTYFTPRQLLSDFFRTSQTVTYRKVEIDAAARALLTERLGYAPPRSSYTFYVGMTGSHIDGYALIDEQKGEHLPITFAVKLSPTGVVERQEIVAYREERGDEVRDERFRRQFIGKTVHDPVATDQDIVAVSGATISSRAMTVGVRRALVLFDVLLRPQLVTAEARESRPAPAKF